MRLFLFFCAPFVLVACQDSYASNSERETHMGEVRAAPPPSAPAAPATPPSASGAPAMAPSGTATGSAPATPAINH